MLVAPKDGGVLASLKRANKDGPTQRGFQQMVPHTKQWAEQGGSEDDRQQVDEMNFILPFFSFFFLRDPID